MFKIIKKLTNLKRFTVICIVLALVLSFVPAPSLVRAEQTNLYEESLPSGVYYIFNEDFNRTDEERYLQAEEYGNQNVIASVFHGGATQQWRVERQSDGSYMLYTNRLNYKNYALSTSMSRKAEISNPGMPVEIILNDDGTYRIVLADGTQNQCLTPNQGDLLEPYTQCYFESFFDNTHQKWHFPSVVSEVIIAPKQAAMVLGNQLNLTRSVLPGNPVGLIIGNAIAGYVPQDLTWESDNPGVATVNASGKVTAVGCGTAKIKATSVVDPTKFDTSVVTVSGDEYEPNETRDTAYPYANIPTMQTSITTINDLYRLEYKQSKLYSTDDVDWYKVTLQGGTEIFASLRNFSMLPYNMEIYYGNESSPIFSSNQTKFNGKPEKYHTFVAPATGTYYVKIYTLGALSGNNYFFYIGPKNQNFEVVNIPLGKVPILSTSEYKGLDFDMKSYVPKSAIIKTLSISNGISPNGTALIAKRVRPVSYSNPLWYTNAGSGTTINNISGVSLYQTFRIEGQNLGALYLPDWIPYLDATFSCTMDPYPGNEISGVN